MQLQPEDTKKVEDKLKSWSQELQDMSGRNRLLFYKDTKTSNATIELPGFIELFERLVEFGSDLFAPLPDPKEAKSIFEDVPDEIEKVDVKASKPQKPRKENEIETNHSVAVLNKVLYNLRYTARTIQEEQGFNVVYVTFGMLKWKEAQYAEFSFAPLVLVPVYIEREGLSSPYKISMAEDDIVLNPVLLTKLSKDFNLQLPEITNDLSVEQLKEFLAVVRQQVNEFDGWEVLEKATIGAFNFLTMLLIKDFENYSELYKLHPIIQLLSGITIEINQPDVVPALADELDDLVDPLSVFQIMDADSSQQEAIEAAKRGISFVLQGPPGTGKSQTISNIISEFLMAGKKVLFVSQKMAALEVVQSRLTSKGLGEFCLEAHSHKMDKRKAIDSLMQSLTRTQPPTSVKNYQGFQQEIKQVKKELNGFVKQLHEKGTGLDLSLYEIQGNIAGLLDAPQVNFYFSEVDKTSAASLSKIFSLIKELESYPDIISSYKVNRWKGCKIVTSSIQDREKQADQLMNAGNAIERLGKSFALIALRYGLPRPQTLKDSLDYLGVLQSFGPEVFSRSLKETIVNYLENYGSFTRYLNPQYWRDSSKLRLVYKRNTRPDPKGVSTILKIVKSLQDKATIESTQTGNLSPKEIEELIGLKIDLENGFSVVNNVFNESDIPEPLRLDKNPLLEDARRCFLDLAQNTNELSGWANFNAVVRECQENKLGDFVNKALEAEIPLTYWRDSFLRRFYLLLEESLVVKKPLVQKFRGTLQTEMVQRFRDLDIALIEGAPHVIRERLYAGKPKDIWVQSGSAETTILKKEFNKKRRIMPLRKLFHEIPNLIQALKPCLMMSPLTVCQLLDPHIYNFDLVIFDEASQIPPEYAIGAFMRSRQIIVAGDRQQLPPTNFFRNIESEESDDYETSETSTEDKTSYESILNACDSSGFPSKMLNWHYRSKDESLITFSNYHFYDNRLFTFPNPSFSSDHSGLKFVYVKDGVYKRGAGARFNIIEAKRVAQLVHEHLLKTPDLSLGIVTFSMSQRKAVEAEIELLRKENPEMNALFSSDRDEAIFVKNLENVQGDERDVIILSVGYGKDEAGKMAMNFGPINRDGGARRLNVAVTRARYALMLVASIEPEDIDLARSNSTGAKLLRNYLEAARDGVKAIYKDESVFSSAEFESPFEESVYKALSGLDLKILLQVGVSNYRVDMAVVDPDQQGRFLLGIECDGAMYHSASTTRDRDRLRQQVLEGLGWKIHRIWSRDWIQNKKSEIDKVLKAVYDAKNTVSEQRSTSGKKKLIDDNIIINPLAGQETASDISNNGPPGTVPYKERKLVKQVYGGGEVFLNTPSSRISDAFKAIVDAEGPISISVAKERVLDAWSTRKGSKIDMHLNQSISYGHMQNKFVVKGAFIWPQGMSTPPLRTHEDGTSPRSLNEIPPEEIMLAIFVCVKNALGIFSEDLARETLRLFGLTATRDNLSSVQTIISHLISTNVLNVENNKISISKKSS